MHPWTNLLSQLGALLSSPLQLIGCRQEANGQDAWRVWASQVEHTLLDFSHCLGFPMLPFRVLLPSYVPHGKVLGLEIDNHPGM